MDLLGSIMNSMDKPPGLTEKEKEVIKSKFNYLISMQRYCYYCVLNADRKEYLKKKDEAEKEYLKKFKENIERTMLKHFENDINTYIKFAPMDHIRRSIV